MAGSKEEFGISSGAAVWALLPSGLSFHAVCRAVAPGQWFPPALTVPMDMRCVAPGVSVAHMHDLKASFSYVGAEHMGIFGTELTVEAHKIALYSSSSHRHRWFSRIQLCCQLFLLYSHCNRW